MMGGNMISWDTKDYCITASGGQVHTFIYGAVDGKNDTEK